MIQDKLFLRRQDALLGYLDIPLMLLLLTGLIYYRDQLHISILFLGFFIFNGVRLIMRFFILEHEYNVQKNNKKSSPKKMSRSKILPFRRKVTVENKVE